MLMDNWTLTPHMTRLPLPFAAVAVAINTRHVLNEAMKERRTLVRTTKVTKEYIFRSVTKD